MIIWTFWVIYIHAQLINIRKHIYITDNDCVFYCLQWLRRVTCSSYCGGTRKTTALKSMPVTVISFPFHYQLSSHWSYNYGSRRLLFINFFLLINLISQLHNSNNLNYWNILTNRSARETEFHIVTFWWLDYIQEGTCKDNSLVNVRSSNDE